MDAVVVEKISWRVGLLSLSRFLLSFSLHSVFLVIFLLESNAGKVKNLIKNVGTVVEVGLVTAALLGMVPVRATGSVEGQVKAMATAPAAGVVMEPVQLVLEIVTATGEETAAVVVRDGVPVLVWDLGQDPAMAEVQKEPDTVLVRVLVMALALVVVVAVDTVLAVRKDMEVATALVAASEMVMGMGAAEEAGTGLVPVRVMGMDLGRAAEEVPEVVPERLVEEVLEAVRGLVMARVVDMVWVRALVMVQVLVVGLDMDMELDLVMEMVILVVVASSCIRQSIGFICYFLEVLWHVLPYILISCFLRI